MIDHRITTGTITNLVDLLKASGFCIDAQIIRKEAHASGLSVELSGEDISLFERNDGDLLKAVNQLAVAALRLSPEDEDLVCFHVDRPGARVLVEDTWQTAS